MPDNDTDGGGVTTVKVKQSTWQRLNRRKLPGDSFDDVIQDLLDAEEDEQGNRTAAKAIAD